MQIIYVDVLIVLNIYVTYLLIKATARFSHIVPRPLNLICASVAGSMFSLVILIPEINSLLMFIIKASASFLIVFLAFGKKRFAEYIKTVIFFYIINFAFAGIILALKYFFNPQFVHLNNSFVYMDFSLLSLVIFTAAAYFIITAVRFLIDKSKESSGEYSVIIKNADKIFTVSGIADTGNALTDVFSGRPVIVCPASAFEDFLKEQADSVSLYEYMTGNKSMKGVRLIPYATIGGDGTIPAFIPDEVIIRSDSKYKAVDAMIGINQKETAAIFNPKILI
ncbi:MAG: sigma-E processing peptidase SpoIIGA [Oscillospiraceae bacterium]|nr:sigma-E processing peptidase SpoIIGA [Oscillospiraceae bacterium]